MDKTLETLLGKFASIRLEEMEAVKLMNRIDTKFVAPRSVLCDLLADMMADYRVQEVEGKRISPYHTLYLDTPACDMYLCHHDQRLTRQKIRIREYIDSDLTFFEIKRKNNHGRTKKKRVIITDMHFSTLLSEQAQTKKTGNQGTVSNGYLSFQTQEDFPLFYEKYAAYGFDTLIPHVENRFRRITLVNNKMTERLTIDCDLNFHNDRTGTDTDLSDFVIIELKQDGNIASEARKTLNKFRIKKSGFSKYCMGAALTDPTLKRNNFKKKLRKLSKMKSNAERELSKMKSQQNE